MIRAFVEKHGGVVFFLALVVLIIEGDFVSPSPWVVIGQIAGAILLVYSRAMFARKQFRTEARPGEGALIRRGPYRVIRHPIYTGALLLTWASILGHPSIFNFIIGAAVLVVVLWRVSMEEKYLSAAYPEYAEYARHSWRLVPGVY